MQMQTYFFMEASGSQGRGKWDVTLEGRGGGIWEKKEIYQILMIKM
jgi:hypothetical protein